ncbi:HlyD family efflux transporter periplasmic adaptor subunit [Anaerorhabdus furcosa]|uniref:HlyD family secretion protein n=1 Tax=Anaerorhabdus furcosa TaxID=118967 RepID=A0A1T4LLT3_9FIRM|nr:HlyD family efflux transporter periplasmic adaptor subunit [Anaerorhabdus furcosa]SJZ55601.1 HlyD family secretion protein [Anaerorhabdus furcosa]
MKISKKNKWIVVGISCLVSLLLVTQIILAKGKDREEDILYREYPVTTGDIVVGVDGNGTLKLEGDNFNYEDELVVEEIYVKVGDWVEKETKLVKLSIESIDEKLKILGEEKKKAEDEFSQTKNNKDIQNSSSNNEWNNRVNNSKNTFESKKAQLENDIANIVQSIQIIQARILELENLISQAPSPIEEGSIEVNNENDLGNGTTDIPNVDELKKELEEKKKELVDAQNKETTLRKELTNLQNTRNAEINEEKRQKDEKDAIQSKNNANFDTTLGASERDLNKINIEIEKYQKLKNNPYLVTDVEGVVIDISYKENKKVDPQEIGITIGKPEGKYVLVSVDQESILKLEEGQEVKLRFNAYGDEEFIGVLSKRDLVGKNANGVIVYEVYVELNQTDKELLSGMSCTVTFITKEIKDVIKLSNKAIQIKDGKQIVLVQGEDKKIEEREIQTGFSDGKVSEITNGLKDGDIVVVGE